ncbi:MAG: ABC-2 family transporter protein [Dermabacter sp.]|nr:ABC-2 family transporter protein [Dermabacter sp.]
MRTANIFRALLHQELLMISNYRWWLLAMQLSVASAPLISLLAWRGSIALGATPPVTTEYLTSYLILVSVVTMLTSSWTAPFLAESIRMGTLNSWLVRPCSTHVASAANNIAEKLAKLITLTPVILILAIYFRESFTLPTDLRLWAAFVLSLLLAAVMVYALDIAIGALAFWWEDIASLERFRQLVAVVLSGAVVPFATLPDSWQEPLRYQPFAYLASVPLDILLRPEQIGIIQSLLIECLWVAGALGLAVTVWRLGIKQYKGAGA